MMFTPFVSAAAFAQAVAIVLGLLAVELRAFERVFHGPRQLPSFTKPTLQGSSLERSVLQTMRQIDSTA
jgi:hypothetical protein